MKRKPNKPKTSGYKPIIQYWGQQARDLPLFNPYWHVPLMMLEPSVRLGLAMRAGPICQAEFAYKEGDDWKEGIESADPFVAAFVERNLKRIWKNYISGLLDAQKWGWAAAEVVLKQTSAGQVEVAELLHRQANDVRPITQNGSVAGVRFLRIENAKDNRVDLPFPYCLWHAFRPEPGQYFGWSICKGAFSPFVDKWWDGGALDVRRLFMHKDAYGGVDVSYPEGYTEIPVEGSDTPRSVPNRDIAREIGEQIKAGAVTSRPSSYDQNGNEQWTITRATVPSNPAHILTYPKDLDTEIYRGLEIPDDVLESTEGSGGAWAGKTVPQGAFYTGLELWLRQLVNDIKSQVMDPLVRLNFGRDVWYEITTKPLALQATEQQGKQPSGAAAPPEQGNPLMMSLEAIGRGVPAGPIVKAAKRVRRAKRMAIDEPHEFSSTQFNLPGDLAFEVRQLGERIPKDDLQPTDYGDVADTGLELNPHITVKYGLHTDNPDDVRAIVESLPPVAVQFGPVSVFEGENYDVVKIEIESKGLRELNAAIAALPNGDVHPEYKPHCTIAYVRKGLGEMYASRLNDLEGRVAVFDRLIFSSKDRSHTSILLQGKPKRFSLGRRKRA